MGGNQLFLLLLAISSEVAGVLGLLAPDAGDRQLVAYLLAHAVASAILSLIFLPLLPSRYRGQPVLAGLFLFTVQFAIPFIGSLGLLLGILLALYLPREPRQLPWQEFEIPELPYQPVDMDLQVVYSQGGLRQVLREASNPDKRLSALMATRQMSERDAVAILREALKDPTDDVRLLAYSMLEQKEKTLARRAMQLQSKLAGADDTDRFRIKRRLAQVWWEMAYLGLAQGGLRRHYLHSAAGILRELVSAGGQHNDWRLLGRVELALEHHEAAETAFNAALEGGSAPEAIQPYLGELAFLRRDFAQVRHHLSACAPERFHPANRPVIEFWL
jgi:hypothetical protein